MTVLSCLKIDGIKQYSEFFHHTNSENQTPFSIQYNQFLLWETFNFINKEWVKILVNSESNISHHNQRHALPLFHYFSCLYIAVHLLKHDGKKSLFHFKLERLRRGAALR